MTEILLVRHGQTDWNIQGRLQGHSDIPLNAEGLLQARTFAESLAGEPYHAVYSSDLQRALQTARLIAEQLSIPLFIDPRLREVDHGDWEGMLIKDVLNQFDEEYTAFRENRPGARPPGGETCGEAALRIEAAVDEIAAKYPNGKVILVSHGLVQAILRCVQNKQLLGLSFQYKMDNCAGELIHWDAGKHLR